MKAKFNSFDIGKYNLSFILLNIYILLLILIPKSFSTVFGVLPIRLILPLILLLSFIFEYKKKKIVLNNLQTRYFIVVYVLFLLFTIPSLFVSKDLVVSIYTLCKFSMFFIVFIFAVKTKFTKNQYKILIKTFLVGITIVVFLGLLNYFFANDIFKIGIDKYLGAKGRINSTFFNSIYFGVFINLVFPFCLYFYHKCQTKKSSFFLGIICVLLYACLIMTFTRSSFLVFWGIMFLIFIIYTKLLINKKVFIILILIGALTFLIPGSKHLLLTSVNDGLKLVGNYDVMKNFLPGNSKEIVKPPIKPDFNIDDSDNSSSISDNQNNNGKKMIFDDYSLIHREEFASIANRIAQDNKLTGVGFGAYIDYMQSKEFAKEYSDYKSSKTHPHSSFVLMNAEVSIIPVVFFSLFLFNLLWISFWSILKNYKIKNENFEISALTLAVIVGFIVVNLIAENVVYDTQMYPIFLIISGLSINYSNSMLKRNKKKVLFISSTGGHLSEMMQLKSMFKKYDYHIITEKTKQNKKLSEKYPNRVNYLIFGSKSNMVKYPFKLFMNSCISLFLYFKIKPKYIITTGAHTAGPMCCIGKIFGSKIIYIESFANINTKTVTGKLIYKIADLFIVQWESMLDLYPKAKFGGWIF